MWSVAKSLDPTGDHSKNIIDNLFAIFFKKKPQSQASKVKSIFLTTSYRQALVVEGFEILSVLNKTSASEEQSFALVGGS